MSEIVFGRNAVEEAFRSGKEIEKVYMQNTLRGEFEVLIRNLCKDRSIPLAKVPDAKLSELCGPRAVHQGVVAAMSQIAYADYREVIARAFEGGRNPLLVVLDSVTDVRNIGAVARSAWFFGADAIVLSGNISGRISEDAVKASAGAILSIPVCRESSVFRLISELQSLGVSVAASGLKSQTAPDQADLTVPVALLMGSEEKGLHFKVHEVADMTIKIPAGNDFDSLNVSVAAGILLYEAGRQRRQQ